jgi:MacB-like periplasmic core domain
VAGGSGRRFRSVLVSGQLALALLLLAGAGLMIKTVVRTFQVHTDYDASRVLVGDLELADPRYDDEGNVRTFASELLEQLKRIPGVRVSVSRTVFFAGFGAEPRRMTVDGLGEVPAAASPHFYFAVTPEYFAVFDMKVREGRLFTSTDGTGLVVVNEYLARQVWPDRSPLGQRIRFGDAAAGARWHTVVGVVNNSAGPSYSGRAQPSAWIPFLGAPGRSLSIAVGTSTDPAPLVSRSTRRGRCHRSGSTCRRCDDDGAGVREVVATGPIRGAVDDVARWRRAAHGRDGDVRGDRLRRQPANARDRRPPGARRDAATDRIARRVGRSQADGRRPCVRSCRGVGVDTCTRRRPVRHEPDGSDGLCGRVGNAGNRRAPGKLAARTPGPVASIRFSRFALSSARSGREKGKGKRKKGKGVLLLFPLKRDAVVSTVQVVHRLDREQDREVEFGVFLRPDEPQIELVRTLDHVLDHLIDRVLVLAGP